MDWRLPNSVAKNRVEFKCTTVFTPTRATDISHSPVQSDHYPSFKRHAACNCRDCDLKTQLQQLIHLGLERFPG